MSENENDLNMPNNKINHHKNHNWPHVAIVGSMAVSLGTAVVTGLKKIDCGSCCLVFMLCGSGNVTPIHA